MSYPMMLSGFPEIIKQVGKNPKGVLLHGLQIGECDRVLTFSQKEWDWILSCVEQFLNERLTSLSMAPETAVNDRPNLSLNNL